MRLGLAAGRRELTWQVSFCGPSADEKNPTSKEIIMKRVEGYMTRAEQLRGMLEKENAPKPVAAAVDMDK